jgi:hypothetical protein
MWDCTDILSICGRMSQEKAPWAGVDFRRYPEPVPQDRCRSGVTHSEKLLTDGYARGPPGVIVGPPVSNCYI